MILKVAEILFDSLSIKTDDDIRQSMSKHFCDVVVNL